MKLRAIKSQSMIIVIDVFKTFEEFGWSEDVFQNLKRSLIKNNIHFEMSTTEKLVYWSLIEKNKPWLNNIKGISFPEFSNWHKTNIKKDYEVKGYYFGLMPEDSIDPISEYFDNKVESTIKEEEDEKSVCDTARVCIFRFDVIYYWALQELKLRLEVKTELLISFNFYYFQKGYTLIFKLQTSVPLTQVVQAIKNENLTGTKKIEEDIKACESNWICKVNRFMEQYISSESSAVEDVKDTDFQFVKNKIVNQISS